MAKKTEKKIKETIDFKVTSLEQYRTFAIRTKADLGKDNDHAHLINGIVTEIGEFCDIFKKNLAYKKPIDWVNAEEEIADQFWYLVNESLVTPFSLVRDESLINYFKKTYDNKLDIDVAGIESTRLLIVSLNKKEYLNFYLNWLFYLTERFNFNLYVSLTKNILKLAERFGDKFSEIKALNRNLEKEREILETKIETLDNKDAK